MRRSRCRCDHAIRNSAPAQVPRTARDCKPRSGSGNGGLSIPVQTRPPLCVARCSGLRLSCPHCPCLDGDASRHQSVIAKVAVPFNRTLPPEPFTDRAAGDADTDGDEELRSGSWDPLHGLHTVARTFSLRSRKRIRRLVGSVAIRVRAEGRPLPR